MDAALHPAPKRPVRVLLVDDDADTLRMLQRLLQWEDLDVIPATGFDEALRLGLTRAPDVLVSDIRLPDGSGWQLMERLKAAHPRLVGVAASGLDTAQDVARSERAGYCAHLTKPVDFTTLHETIRRCVETRREAS